jgi:hypothetical protein
MSNQTIGGNSLEVIGKLIIVLILVVLILMIYLLSRSNSSKLFSEHDIFVKNLPDGIQGQKFIWITNPMKIKQIKNLKNQYIHSDVIVIIAGNITRYHSKLEKLGQSIQALSEIGPVHYIWNDQDYNGKFREMNAFLLENRVTILENTATNFETSDGSRFSLIGLDDVKGQRDQLHLALQDCQSDSFSMLFSFDEKIETDTSLFKSIPLYLFQHGNSKSSRNDYTNYIDIDLLEKRKSKGILGLLFILKGV